MVISPGYGDGRGYMLESMLRFSELECDAEILQWVVVPSKVQGLPVGCDPAVS